MAILDFALGRSDIPAEALGQSRINISGGDCVCIENHRGLLEYAPDYLSVARRGGAITIRGRELEIAAMDSERLVVNGHIFGVDLE